MEQDSKYYDEIFSTDSYKKKPEEMPWYPLWMSIIREIKSLKESGNAERVIDLGCGPGHFAELLNKEIPGLDYSGVDFSEVAIEEARKRCPYIGYAFNVEDIRDTDFQDGPHPTVYIFSEVLEHIDMDTWLLGKIPVGSAVILTVPDFDDPGHVRKFTGTWEVVERYGPLIDIDSVGRLETGRHFMMTGARKEEDEEEEKTVYPGITLVMQVCDEEVGIGKAIDSVKKEIQTALVSVDDQTVDSTQLVAEDHGALTYKMKWKNDFAGARNALDRRVKTEWVLVLDGHEYLMEGSIEKAIRKFPEAAAIECMVEMDDGKRHTHMRLYKPKHCHWENSEHNILKIDGKTEKFHEMVVKHDRKEGQSLESRLRRAAKRDQHLTINLYKKAVDSPTDTRSMFYLAQQHRDSGRWEAAYYWYDRYCRTIGGNQWQEELYQAHLNAGRAAMALNDIDGAGSHAERATALMPKRGEAWALSGDIHYRGGNYGHAFTAYSKAEACPMPTNAKLWVDENLHQGGYKLLDVMSMCCWRVGNYEKGEELCIKLLEHPKLPERERARIEDNLSWHRKKLEGTP
jgi:tetratricopeptide (TPR) repeat protein